MNTETAPKITSISIVIPAFNEEKTIKRCLDSIYHQETNNITFEVIIVDDGSKDRTAQAIKDYTTQNNIKNITLIKNTKNIGRFETRLKGIRESKFKTILLIDSKVTLSKTAFRAIQNLGYEPLVATNTTSQQDSNIERTYFLIRKKVYKGNFPKMKNSPSFITKQNFDTHPKGTTTFLCDKDLLLSSLPSRTDHNSSDDTAWLKNISTQKPLMISNDFEFTYTPRNKLTDKIIHLFLRGPKFADYYYQPGRRFFKMINLSLTLLILAITISFIHTPALPLILSVAFIFLLAISAYLAEKPKDIAILIATLPVIAAVFGSGILYGIILKIKTRS